MDDPTTVVSTEWLARQLGAADLRVLDATWFLPTEGRDAAAEFAAGHIPGARFFNIDEVADTASDLPHMAPSPVVFARAVSGLGIRDGDRVVVYDRSGIRSSARVWWTFRLMGWSSVAVLDGGFEAWVAEGRPVEAGTPQPVADDRAVNTDPRPALVSDRAAVAAASATGGPAILDARPAARFRGDAPEPRAGLAAGHIPGARNLPHSALLTAEGKLRPEAELRAAFAAAGIDLARPVITTCGSGVTASVLALALERVGHRDWSVYDGSWADWGSRTDTAIATGDA